MSNIVQPNDVAPTMATVAPDRHFRCHSNADTHMEEKQILLGGRSPFHRGGLARAVFKHDQ
jgi:hypothetical protein